MAKDTRRLLPPDVPPNHWAAADVNAGLSKGILRLDDDGTYRGDRPSSRYDMVYGLDVIRQRLLAAPRKWSSLSTWDLLIGAHRFPTATDRIIVPAEFHLKVDVDVADNAGMDIYGTVSASRSNDCWLLPRGNVIVNDSGHLNWGMQTDRLTTQAHLIFQGVDESRFVGGGMGPVLTDTGLWVMGAGRLTMAGQPRAAWLSLALPALAGEREITLDGDPIGWSVGERISIAPTEPPTVAGFSVHFDEAIIHSISGRVVTLVSPLRWNHPAVLLRDGRTFFPEVVNYSAPVSIGGMDATHRAHIFIRSTVPQELRDGLIRFMGPQKNGDFVLGRYPLHIHHCMHGTMGSVVENVTIADSGGPMFVPHMSYGIDFIRDAGYKAGGNIFWWDDLELEQSEDIAYLNCLGALATTTNNNQKHHQQLTAFSMTGGTRVRCEGCHGVGINGGGNSSAFRWPEGSHGVWDWRKNVGHNNKENGTFGWQNDNLAHDVLDFVLYHCGNTGILHGAYDNVYLYKGGIIHGCRQSSIEVHALNKAEQFRPMTFEDIVCDGLGMHDYGIVFPAHTDKVPVVTPALFNRVQVYGYRKAAFAWTYDGHDGDGGPEVYDIVDTTFDASFGGTEFWMGEILPFPESVITVRDPSLGHLELRRHDAPVGVFEPKWNSKVKTLP